MMGRAVRLFFGALRRYLLNDDVAAMADFANAQNVWYPTWSSDQFQRSFAMYVLSVLLCEMLTDLLCDQ
jgi:hypothetical protein